VALATPSSFSTEPNRILEKKDDSNSNSDDDNFTQMVTRGNVGMFTSSDEIRDVHKRLQFLKEKLKAKSNEGKYPSFSGTHRREDTGLVVRDMQSARMDRYQCDNPKMYTPNMSYNVYLGSPVQLPRLLFANGYTCIKSNLSGEYVEIPIKNVDHSINPMEFKLMSSTKVSLEHQWEVFAYGTHRIYFSGSEADFWRILQRERPDVSIPMAQMKQTSKPTRLKHPQFARNVIYLRVGSSYAIAQNNAPRAAAVNDVSDIATVHTKFVQQLEDMLAALNAPK
jgi:hypothetical protein